MTLAVAPKVNSLWLHAIIKPIVSELNFAVLPRVGLNSEDNLFKLIHLLLKALLQMSMSITH